MASAGDKAHSSFTVPAGLSNIPETQVPFLRDCGLRFNHVAGSIYVEKDFPICQTGDILTEQQAKLLVGVFHFVCFKLNNFNFNLFFSS